MNLRDAKLLLSLRTVREGRAAFALAEARRSAVQSAADASAAGAALKAAQDDERQRKRDAYRTLPGRRISGGDLMLHTRKMEALEKLTADRREDFGCAKNQLKEAHEVVLRKRAALRSRLREVNTWKHIADELVEERTSEASLAETLQEDEQASEFFVLSQKLRGRAQ